MGERVRPGQVVRLRLPADILATLDADGCLDGLPFMPEMLRYFGQAHRVTVRVERACDTLTGPGTQRVPDSVILDDLRCNGSGHAGCQARCRIYWKEAWLEPWTAEKDPPAVPRDDAYMALREIARDNAVRSGSGPETVYRCQMTEFLRASKRVSRREAPAAYARELTSGNVRPGHFFRVLARTIVEDLATLLRLRHTFFMPAPTGSPPSNGYVVNVGDLVEVRSKEEIAETLSPQGKMRGLWFDREMLPFCGGTYRVDARVSRFIDEATGQMVHLTSDCFMLDGVVCSGDRSSGRRFCCRAIPPWWRTAWLKPVEQSPAATEAGRTPPAG